jgi:EAL and modified HD-GYP domain-containing signal transduction protein
MSKAENHDLFVPTFIARQPIFDAKQRIWGYELLYRHSSEATAAIFSDEESATLAVAACASCQQMDFAKDSKVLINFSEQSIMENIPLALPADNTIVEIAELSHPSEAYISALNRIKQAGYSIALDGFEGKPESRPLHEISDLVKIDIQNKTPEQLIGIVHKARQMDLPMVAHRVEDTDFFNIARKLDFSYFQGFFFKKPEILEGRALRPNEASRLHLFSIMEKDEPDFDQLTATIQADVAISFSLLSYLNSAAFGMRNKIASIKQALLLLGWKQVKHWLRVIILTDITPSDKTSELPYLAVQRGKFFQLAATASSYKKAHPDSLFLMGLFSLLDVMLSMPMDMVVRSLPLDEAVKDALKGEPNEFRRWIEVALCFETASWDRLMFLLKEMGLDPVNTAQAYYESISWSSVFFQRG